MTIQSDAENADSEISSAGDQSNPVSSNPGEQVEKKDKLPSRADMQNMPIHKVYELLRKQEKKPEVPEDDSSKKEEDVEPEDTEDDKSRGKPSSEDSNEEVEPSDETDTGKEGTDEGEEKADDSDDDIPDDQKPKKLLKREKKLTEKV